MSRRYYRLADQLTRAECKQFNVDVSGARPDGARVMAMIDREGTPEPGHWFISGAQPVAYRMLPGRINTNTPGSSPLAKLVLVKAETKVLFQVIG